MIFRTLRQEELPAWYRHCHAVFTHHGEDGYFQRHFERDPYADLSLIFVAMDGEEIAATVRVFDRHIWIDGQKVHMGGIGEVSTKPEYRRRGLAQELLEMALVAMEKRKMPVSVLFGVEKIYERMGWRDCNAYYSIARTETLPEAACTVRAIADADLPTLMGLYDLYMGRMNGAIVRSEAYWQQWVLPQWGTAYGLVIGERLKGYCAVIPDKEHLFVSEAAIAPDAEDMLAGFLRQVAQKHACAKIKINAPLAPREGIWEKVGLMDMMIRLNHPLDGMNDSDALAATMGLSGVCGVDGF